MCQDFIDEANCENATFFEFLSYVVPLATTVFILLAALSLIESVKCSKRLSISLISSHRSGFGCCYCNIRLKEDFCKSLHNLFHYLNYHCDEESVKNAGLQYFRKESCYNMMHLDAAFKYIQQIFSNFLGEIPCFVLGTDVDEHSTCIEFNNLKNLKKSLYARVGKNLKMKTIFLKSYFMAYISVLLHYFDLTKDLFIIILAWDSSIKVSYAFIIMITMTESANFLTLIFHAAFRMMSLTQKLLHLCCLPFVPCFLQIRLAKLRYKEAQLMYLLEHNSPPC